jgi:hypothetical protein
MAGRNSVFNTNGLFNMQDKKFSQWSSVMLQLAKCYEVTSLFLGCLTVEKAFTVLPGFDNDLPVNMP